jgi:uncharacterized lipoprotein YmbA
VKLLSAVVCSCLLYACAAVQPDHYYILSSQPQGAIEPRTAPATQVTLKVSLPSLVDRYEMVLNTSADGITVLEHERWGAPLTDLVVETLAEDIERRRADFLVSGKGMNQPRGAAIQVAVDMVQITMRRSGQASIEAHWLIHDSVAGKDVSGGEVFHAPLRDDSYAAVARALSDCLGQLSERLARQMPSAERQ